MAHPSVSCGEGARFVVEGREECKLEGGELLRT